MEQSAGGCGLGATLLAHQPDLEKGADCCDPPGTRRTWRQWARRNDCCFAKKNCAGAILCAPYTGVKWFTVGLMTLPLFFTHFGLGLARFFAGGAFHMVCRALCHNKNSTCLTVSYYVFGGVPLLINYLIAACEMLVVLCYLLVAFCIAFGGSLLNPLCAVETCIELMVISDGIYKNIFANLPVALEHPGKLVSPCSFGFAYKSGNEPVQPAEAGPPAAMQLEMQPQGAAVQPVFAEAQSVHMAHIPVVQGIPEGVPFQGTAGSSHDHKPVAPILPRDKSAGASSSKDG